ncbi:hypothetical protein FE633_17560 [Streptomyces montanus]|uniref:Uncharacterized protein n=1 Tax=Streptomyces montanus TaxID=2580423 RepID=A0A5R9FQK0_9ACTN|nr:hypothetical protein [Streptomyces montanus]TLS44949.1 hypothetical protein FE633_17560 [Streptomyces montanus]
MPETKSNKLGTETGTYVLPCGCKIYVYFPGGTIHFATDSVTTKCPELSRLWSDYWASCRNDHNWTSLNNYLACLRHVGAWEGRIAWCEAERDRYPNPADSYDSPTQQTEMEEQGAPVAS